MNKSTFNTEKTEILKGMLKSYMPLNAVVYKSYDFNQFFILLNSIYKDNFLYGVVFDTCYPVPDKF